MIGCGNNDTESSKKIDITKLPSWFDIQSTNKRKARERIKDYEITKNLRVEYADSFLVIGDYDMAARLYYDIYLDGFERGNLLIYRNEGKEKKLGAYIVRDSMDSLAKAIYLRLFIPPDMSMEKLYEIYYLIEQHCFLLRLSAKPNNGGLATMLYGDDGIIIMYGGSEWSPWGEETRITEDGVQSLVDVNAIVESRLKKLGYSPEGSRGQNTNFSNKTE